jgi:hypothetical protein
MPRPNDIHDIDLQSRYEGIYIGSCPRRLLVKQFAVHQSSRAAGSFCARNSQRPHGGAGRTRYSITEDWFAQLIVETIRMYESTSLAKKAKTHE